MLSFFGACFSLRPAATDETKGLFPESSPGPLAPDAGIMPPDRAASCRQAEALKQKWVR